MEEMGVFSFSLNIRLSEERKKGVKMGKKEKNLS
jgi:hypothetical protein